MKLYVTRTVEVEVASEGMQSFKDAIAKFNDGTILHTTASQKTPLTTPLGGKLTLVRDLPELPSVGTQAKNIFGAAGKALLNPTPVSTEERERRLAICNGCEFLIEGKRCSKCGCTVKWKALLEAWHCPVDKW